MDEWNLLFKYSRVDERLGELVDDVMKGCPLRFWLLAKFGS